MNFLGLDLPPCLYPLLWLILMLRQKSGGLLLVIKQPHNKDQLNVASCLGVTGSAVHLNFLVGLPRTISPEVPR